MRVPNELSTHGRMSRGTVSLPGEREMVAEREFDASRARVFEAFHDPTLLPRWWGPAELKTSVEHYDVRPGGKWRIVQRAPDGTIHAFRGEFREVEPPSRVVSTFEYEGAPGQILEQVASFETRGNRTWVQIKVKFPSAATRRGMVEAGMESGMREGWARLDAILAEGIRQ
jgi:uncharacterized protein YndB with AHSA1/START domain